MLNFKIEVMSFLNAFQYLYNCPRNEKIALISIQDYDVKDMPFSYKVGGPLKAVLQLNFDDIDLISPGPAKKLFSDTEAESIKNFIDSIKDSDIEKLIIHCYMGQSRSAAVAAALSFIYDGDDSKFFDEPYCPNQHVYRKILEAYGLNNNGDVFN